jgi:hypothetical protein
MKRRRKTNPGQFTLSLQREPLPQFDAATKKELLNALADLLREALGEVTKAVENEKEQHHESKDHP